MARAAGVGKENAHRRLNKLPDRVPLTDEATELGWRPGVRGRRIGKGVLVDSARGTATRKVQPGKVLGKR